MDVAQIGAARVKELRERTGVGMMDCKQALMESDGNLERASDLLRERGLTKARRREGRETSEGLIVACVSADGRVGALVEVNCETDFVAKTPDFQGLVRVLAELARDHGPDGVDALLELPVPGSEENARDRLLGAISKLGENIQVSRLTRLEGTQGSLISSYIHAGGKIGTLVKLEAQDPSAAEVSKLGHNLCMHVAATSPLSISREDLPSQEVERERGILESQAAGEGKPAAVIAKMVEGRLKKYFKEIVLLEQTLVMDPDQTVASAVEAAGARVAAIARYQLGEKPGA